MYNSLGLGKSDMDRTRSSFPSLFCFLFKIYF
jgi:hypothetical protein